MEPKRSKYDTNPLDENVADRAKKSWSQTSSETGGSTTETMGHGPTRVISRPGDADAVHAYSESEAPTRRIDDNLGTSYPSIFVPPTPRPSVTYQPPRVPAPNIYHPPPAPPPNIYQPPPLPVAHFAASRTVAGLGIAEKWANLLPYIPGHLGAIAAAVELLLVPRSETRTRFHAAQGLALQLAILIITGALSFVTLISGSSFGSGLFRFASTIFLVISMVRVWQGRSHHIAPLDEATRWLDEKISPRK